MLVVVVLGGFRNETETIWSRTPTPPDLLEGCASCRSYPVLLVLDPVEVSAGVSFDCSRSTMSPSSFKMRAISLWRQVRLLSILAGWQMILYCWTAPVTYSYSSWCVYTDEKTMNVLFRYRMYSIHCILLLVRMS